MNGMLLAFFYPRNYVPLGVAYAASMLVWGLILLVEPQTSALYASFAPAYHLWAWLTVALGAALLVLLHPRLRRYLVFCNLLATFLWLWIDVGFYLAAGQVTTAQAMYSVAAVFQSLFASMMTGASAVSCATATMGVSMRT